MEIEQVQQVIDKFLKDFDNQAHEYPTWIRAKQICGLEQQDDDPEWDGARHHPELDEPELARIWSEDGTTGIATGANKPEESEPKPADEKLRKGVAEIVGRFTHLEDTPSGRIRLGNLTEEETYEATNAILAYVRPRIEAEARKEIADGILQAIKKRV